MQPPLEPMLAKAQATVPADEGVWSYEPKWDGFRALAFRDGHDVVLLSRSGKDLGRYFPEVIDAVRNEGAPRCVLDGEIVLSQPAKTARSRTSVAISLQSTRKGANRTSRLTPCFEWWALVDSNH